MGKLTAPQVRKITETAAELGYALEPDARVQRKTLSRLDEIAIWRSEDTSSPDPVIYGGAFILLTLAMQVAMADGSLADEEAHAMISMLTDVFTLDDLLRKRLVALQQLLARQPIRAAAHAKKLQTTRTREERRKIGRVLVSIATADGVVAEQEHVALRSLFKALGLTEADLDTALVSSGIMTATDTVVEVRPASLVAEGERIPAAPTAVHGVQLDQAAIAAIIADTRDVTAMLAEVFDNEPDVDDTPSAPVPEVIESIAPQVEDAMQGLDLRYREILSALVSKSVWTRDEVRALALERNLMPGAILETINTWSEETFGDFLIDDADGWHIHSELLQKDIL